MTVLLPMAKVNELAHALCDPLFIRVIEADQARFLLLSPYYKDGVILEPGTFGTNDGVQQAAVGVNFKEVDSNDLANARLQNAVKTLQDGIAEGLVPSE